MKKTVREEKTNTEYVSELSACELTLANQASKDQIKYKAHTQRKEERERESFFRMRPYLSLHHTLTHDEWWQECTPESLESAGVIQGKSSQWFNQSNALEGRNKALLTRLCEKECPDSDFPPGQVTLIDQVTCQSRG